MHCFLAISLCQSLTSGNEILTINYIKTFDKETKIIILAKTINKKEGTDMHQGNIPTIYFLINQLNYINCIYEKDLYLCIVTINRRLVLRFVHRRLNALLRNDKTTI